MAFVVADRVKETSTSTGTGTITLAGAVTGFQSFAAVGNGNTTYYCIASQSANEWEVGLGTYTSLGTTLARTTVLSSSNGGSLVNFSAGTKDVFVTYPAGYSVYSDGTRASGTWAINISGNAATVSSIGTTQVTNLYSPNGATVVDPGTAAAMPAQGQSFIHTLGTGPGGNDGHLLAMSWASTTSIYGAQLWVDTDPTNTMSIRSRSAGGVWNAWADVITSWSDNQTKSGYFQSNSSLRAPIFYDSNDTGYYIDPASASDSALRMRGGALFGPNTTWSAYLYVGTNGNPGTSSASVCTTNGNLHLDAADGYALYLNNYSTNSYTIASQSIRSPIFYDANNTGYYVDPASTSNLSGLTVASTISGSINGNAATASNAALLNSISAVNLFNNMGDVHAARTSFDAQGATSTVDFGWRYVQGSTNGPGTNSASQYYSAFVGLGSNYAYNTYGMQIAIPRNVTSPYLSVRYEEGGAFGAWTKISAGYADSAGSAGSVDYNNLTNKTGGTGTYTTSGDYRAPIFYDSNNTGYYVDPASTSNVNQINMAGYIRRNSGAAGYLEGAYAINTDGNNSGAIYTIGGSYQPASTSLNNMYGVGYTVGNGTPNPGLGQTGWGFYVASGGVSRIFFDSDNGVGIASASFRAPIFYDSNNTGYYVDPASTSLLNGLTVVSTISGSISGTAATATNIANGTANRIPYQTGSSATAFIAAPTSSSTYLQWNGTAFTWAAAGGGAAAGGAVYENTQTISANYTMTTNYNGVSAGPITINTGVTVTIPTGSSWSIV